MEARNKKTKSRATKRIEAYRSVSNFCLKQQSEKVAVDTPTPSRTSEAGDAAAVPNSCSERSGPTEAAASGMHVGNHDSTKSNESDAVGDTAAGTPGVTTAADCAEAEGIINCHCGAVLGWWSA